MNFRSKRGGAVCGFPCESVRAFIRAFLWRLIMTRPTRGICEMFGKWSALAAPSRAEAETAVTVCCFAQGLFPEDQARAVQLAEGRFPLGRGEAAPVDLSAGFRSQLRIVDASHRSAPGAPALGQLAGTSAA